MVKRLAWLVGAVAVAASMAAALLLARRAGREARAEAAVVRLDAPDGRPEMLGDGQGTKLEAVAVDVPSTLSWRVAVPEGARLVTDLAFDRSKVGPADLACRARVEWARGGGPPEVLVERAVEPRGPWRTFATDLGERAAPDAELRLTLACRTPDGTAAVLPRAARWSLPVVYQPRRPPAPNVVLVTVDTLRADHLGAYGYSRPTSPGVDRLARRGVLFRNAESVQSATWPALASLHTSQPPGRHGVIWNGWHLREGATTLAGLLRAKGYDTSAFLTNMTGTRHPGFSRLFLARGGAQAEMDRRATDAAVEHLGRVGDRRFFLWLHLLSPHADYAPPPPYDTAFTRPGASTLSGTIKRLAEVRARGVRLSDADVAHVVALYDGEVAYADAQVDRLLSELRARGLERSTLVVFTADHGEDLHEHNRYFFHAASMYSSSLHVPLILSWPEVLPAGARVDHPASLVDVAPTVLSLLGLPAPSSFLGKDLLPGRKVPAQPPRAVAYSETNGRIFGARTSEWRFVYNPDKLHPEALGGPYPIGDVELYDLRRDPREGHDVAGSRGDLVASFTAQVLAWKEHERRGDGAPEQTIDPHTRQELEALGYIVH
jgi:arylsulfatase A-like enzyme